MSADLVHGHHRFRNAVEDYEHLRAGGVSHEFALKRIGYTAKEWENANHSAAHRKRVKERAS